MQYFTNYILDLLVFATVPSEKHSKRLEAPEDYQLLNCKFEEAPVKSFPANSSFEVAKELEFLQELRAQHPNPTELEEKYDDDFLWAVKKMIKDAGYEWNKDFFNRILDEAGSIAIRLKYKYNRPRPYQVAAAKCILLAADESDTAKTPSFPSGHALQSTLVAMVVGKLYPELSQSALELAEDVMLSRMVGGHHFPSDIQYGKEIGQWLFMHTNI